MSKPCEIPRNLKPGDLIVDSEGTLHPFECYLDDDAVCTLSVFTSDGRRYRHGMTRPFATRIIRKSSKPAKVKKDKDAEFIRSICDYSTPTHARRLRRIAKRLESMQ